MTYFSITTDRLILIAGTLELITAEINNRHELEKLLNVKVPENWPPPLNDEQSMEFAIKFFRENPDPQGWGFWYFVLKNSGKGKPLAIGNGGFKGKPSVDGTVEIGYSIMENYQKNGYGTEATRALVDWAFSHSNVTRVIAETLPDLRPSIRVLERNGFTYIGKGSEEGVIRFEHRKDKIDKYYFVNKN
jgi:ribosomal-protein-alanine N-acetyltransferase